MIEERVEAGKKNIEWLRKDFKKRPGIKIIRISQTFPVKKREGRYCFHVSYERVYGQKRSRK
ncbi:MAG: hypothetical protein K5985_02975 [Lachnospiraceae bacterium]|nr:hypothetical protein [Lachnospiraceae bacterium]